MITDDYTRKLSLTKGSGGETHQTALRINSDEKQERSRVGKTCLPDLGKEQLPWEDGDLFHMKREKNRLRFRNWTRPKNGLNLPIKILIRRIQTSLGHKNIF